MIVLSYRGRTMRTSGIPIIFVHTGNAQEFAHIAFRQAVRASPFNKVVLLTDVRRSGLDGVTQVMLADYDSAAIEFERLYRHTSVNRLEYERFCFSRWFYVGEFVRRHGIERFCILDSDILLFAPIEHFVAAFDGYEAGNWAWANVITAPALDTMCEYFETIFRHNQLLHSLANKYRIGDKPHLSDMMALWELAAGRSEFLDQTELAARGFDDRINSSFGGLFVMDDGIKSLWVGHDGIPRARRARDGVEVPFHFLHFQGPAKLLMPKFAWLTRRDRLHFNSRVAWLQLRLRFGQLRYRLRLRTRAKAVAARFVRAIDVRHS
jgi:hypothetical protein